MSVQHRLMLVRLRLMLPMCFDLESEISKIILIFLEECNIRNENKCLLPVRFGWFETGISRL